jgi:hypothetical protein
MHIEHRREAWACNISIRMDIDDKQHGMEVHHGMDVHHGHAEQICSVNTEV